jgi:hypothetical protein
LLSSDSTSSGAVEDRVGNLVDHGMRHCGPKAFTTVR